MKKSILALTVVAALASCKKETTNEFTQTDVTGTTMVKGNCSKNVITPNGSGGYTTGRIPASSVTISVKVNKNSLYPNSNAIGADVYTGTTDANGNYAISVRSNGGGVNGVITIDGFTGTIDTLINGTTKTGLLANYPGTTFNRTLVMGQNSFADWSFNGNYVTTNPNTVLKIGTATITGSVGVNLIKEVLTGTLVTLTTTNVALEGQKVYLNFSNDPNTLGTRMYEATTDASGYYSFEVSTVASGTSGFNQNATIWVADFATTRDTIKANNTRKTGRAGVFSQSTLFQNGVYNNNIRNAQHLIYSSFTSN